MWTTVSIPDDLFERAEIAARARGWTRSQLYTRALEEYLVLDDTESRATLFTQEIEVGKRMPPTAEEIEPDTWVAAHIPPVEDPSHNS